jgi:hypothetical protein
MSERRMNRLLGNLLTLVFLGTYAFSQVLAPHKPVAPLLPQPWSLHDSPVSRSLLGGLWMMDPNMRASIYITNDLKTSPLTVTPVIYLSNGVKYTLPAVSLEPSGVATVNINDGLAAQGLAPYANLSGYVELQYQWPWDAICATVRNIDPVHSSLFNYSLPVAIPGNGGGALTGATDQVLEGLWWKEEKNVKGFVALSNPSSQPQDASLTVSDNLGRSMGQHDVTVSPYGTKVLALTELLGSLGTSGGVSVAYQGVKDGLVIQRRAQG